MPKIISFDMDGTLVDAEFTDWVWGHGIPTLYAKKVGVSFEEAKALVTQEYLKVGEGAIEWYDIKYWFRFFQLGESWKAVMERYADKIRVYPDVNRLLQRLEGRFPLILTSNAGREFIDLEMEAQASGDISTGSFQRPPISVR
jgi:putative hydrolase of the HAD superfamily